METALKFKMHSLTINQLVTNGLAPLSYAAPRVTRHILDINVLEESSVNDSFILSTDTITSHLLKSDLSIPFDDFPQRSLPSDNMAHSSFSNQNMTILRRSALTSGTATFRRALRDFKMTHKRIFAHEINQPDQHQYTLLWYLTIADLYSSIEELYRLTTIELNINAKNGPFSCTILHYAVIHGTTEGIRIILDIGVDTNLSDRLGRTALHYIALYGTKHKNDVDITKLLIDYGSLPNLTDSMHRTSLHLAIIKENYELIEYLITLPNINVCIRDKQGYSPLCYLCKHILNLSDISLETYQCNDILEQISKIINLIIDRCPSDELSSIFHIINNNQLGENLLLHVYNKLINLTIPKRMNTLFHCLESIITGIHQDHCLFVERLLELHSWKSAVFALCDTHNVNISNALIQCIARDPHVLLIDNISPTSDLSIVFVLIFYALTTDMILLRNVLPLCNCINKNEDNDQPCYLNISNNSLHTTCITFIHTCLRYASLNVFSLKHLCRNYIRRYFKSRIMNKIEACSCLKLKHRDYLKLNELLEIYFKIHDLSFMIYLIKRLYNIHQTDEYHLFEKVDESSIDTFPDDKPFRQRTTDEIMAESYISLHSFGNDQIESESSVQSSSTRTSIKDMSDKSISSLSDDQLENELADMKAKSKDIEDMIDKFLLKN